MPDIINYTYRMWCKSCQDFTIHNREDKEFSCKCGTKHTSVKISEIPTEKVEEQRERFRAQRNKRTRKLLSTLGMSSGLNSDFFKAPSVGNEIIESDAGLEKLEAYEKAKKDKERRDYALELERFKGLGRNEICLCGSGLKYKKCCYSKYNK